MADMSPKMALWGRTAIQDALGGCSVEEFRLLVRLGMPVARRRGGKYVAHYETLNQWFMSTIDYAHRQGCPLEFLEPAGGYGAKEGGGVPCPPNIIPRHTEYAESGGVERAKTHGEGPGRGQNGGGEGEQ